MKLVKGKPPHLGKAKSKATSHAPPQSAPHKPHNSLVGSSSTQINGAKFPIGLMNHSFEPNIPFS